MQTQPSDDQLQSPRKSIRTAPWEWLLALGVALAMLGPALRPGVIFNLDLILAPRLDTPAGFWGLGPELPRRLPLWLPISWLSPVIAATTLAKALMVALLVAPWIGMARLTSRIRLRGQSSGLLACHAAGALYALSPFLLTRVAVGHFNVTWPHAVLPWVLPTLLRPGRRLDATFLACFAMGFAGHSGGSLVLAIVALSMVLGRRERWIRALLVAVAAQAPWLVPGLVVLAANPIHMASGNAFMAAVDGLPGLARLSAGGGFWNTYFQVGGNGLVVAAAGAVLLVLAVVGTQSIAAEFRVPLIALGALGWLVAAASAIRGLDVVFFWIDDNLLGGVWRESHRLLTLHLLWLSPAAALGGEQLYRACLTRRRLTAIAGPFAVLPLAIAVLLAVPGLWGLEGQVSAARLPHSWQVARDTIDNEPGTVLALPWYQYFNLRVGDGPLRRVLNPLPLYLGGDVLSSSNNGLQRDVREYGDPREAPADALIGNLTNADPISDGLMDIGVRWVMLLKTEQSDDYRALRDDSGLETVIDTADIALYRVVEWKGTAITSDRAPVKLSNFGPAWASVDTGAAVTWFRAGSNGWWQGTRRATITDKGLVGLPGGGGLIWNVATAPALLGQLVPSLAVAVLLVRRRRRVRNSSLEIETVEQCD